MYMYTLPPFIGEVLSEERQLMKWVVIFQVGVFWGDFPGGSLMGGNFRGGGGDFLGENFPRTIFSNKQIYRKKQVFCHVKKNFKVDTQICSQISD